MKYRELLSGLKNGSIKVLNHGHLINDIADEVENNIEHWEECEKEYLKNIADNVPETRENEHKGMLDLYQRFLNMDVVVGKKIREVNNNSCFHCGESIYPILVSDNEISLISYKQLRDLTESYKKEHKFVKEEIEQCACHTLNQEKKLVTKIEVPTGNLIFKNFFRTKEIYEHPEKRSINSLLGRYDLMQYLATKNVGYGQMTNTSVTIYSNKKEIVVTNCYWEDAYMDNKHYFQKNPERLTEEAKKQLEDAENLSKYLKENKLKKRGNICLDVWRWMCADKSILDSYNEPVKHDEYEDVVGLKVEKGTWEIEHYFDFPENGEYFCSKLKLVDEV